MRWEYRPHQFKLVEAARAQTAKVLDKIGFDDGPFNVEFFRDPDSGALNLLEINARMSKSHSPRLADLPDPADAAGPRALETFPEPMQAR
ncbi:ATP-binding protein [Psychromarinibacter sediminicola]|nr:hypothetical protein [Psychromarinibacter sediminicola]